MPARRFAHTASTLVRQILKQLIDLAPTDSQPRICGSRATNLAHYRHTTQLRQNFRLARHSPPTNTTGARALVSQGRRIAGDPLVSPVRRDEDRPWGSVDPNPAPGRQHRATCAFCFPNWHKEQRFRLEGIFCAARNADIGRVPFPTQLQAFCRSTTEMEIVEQF